MFSDPSGSGSDIPIRRLGEGANTTSTQILLMLSRVTRGKWSCEMNVVRPYFLRPIERVLVLEYSNIFEASDV